MANLEEALWLARKEFGQTDPAVMAARCGAVYDQQAESIKLTFLGELAEVCFPSAEIVLGEKKAGIIEEILLLHYLAQSLGGSLQERLVPFRELPGGAIYQGPFQQRTVQPLLHTFGKNPGELLKAGISLGGRPESLGDYGLRVQALPLLPLVLVMWQGDCEFPPSANLLFDASAPRFLPTEDLVQMAALLVKRLCRASGVS